MRLLTTLPFEKLEKGKSYDFGVILYFMGVFYNLTCEILLTKRWGLFITIKYSKARKATIPSKFLIRLTFKG